MVLGGLQRGQFWSTKGIRPTHSDWTCLRHSCVVKSEDNQLFATEPWQCRILIIPKVHLALYRVYLDYLFYDCSCNV